MVNKNEDKFKIKRGFSILSIVILKHKAQMIYISDKIIKIKYFITNILMIYMCIYIFIFLLFLGFILYKNCDL